MQPGGRGGNGIARLRERVLQGLAALQHLCQGDRENQPIEHFGPVGIGIDLLLPPFQMQLSRIDKGSPAEATGKLKVGQMIESINGQTLKDIDPRIQLGAIITKAEATDGVIKFMVKEKPDAKAEEVIVKIPVLGAYSKTWPLNCPKSDKIVRSQAEFPGAHRNHANGMGLGLLFLLSTGEEKDLEVARGWIKEDGGEAQGRRSKIETYPWYAGYGGIGLVRVLPAHRRCVDHSAHREECGLPQAQHVQRRLESKGRGEFRLRPLERGRRSRPRPSCCWRGSAGRRWTNTRCRSR